MLKFTPTRGVVAPLAMTVATAAFLFAGTATPSFAQTQAKPAAANAATSMRPGTVDERITQLHRQLKITAGEEQDWQTVAQVMKSNADDMKSLIDQTRSEAPKAQRNALEDLQTYQKFAQAHAEGLQKLTTAFATLYDAMTPEQKANADKVFRSFEHQRPRGRS
jgi:periplasmic protein CpxP/Spy